MISIPIRILVFLMSPWLVISQSTTDSDGMEGNSNMMILNDINNTAVGGDQFSSFIFGKGSASPGLSGTSIDKREEWVSIEEVLKTIVDEYAGGCSLSIFYERPMVGMAMTLTRTLQHKGIKLYQLSTEVLEQEAIWNLLSMCEFYIFLINEGDVLFNHASVNHLQVVPSLAGQSPKSLWNKKAFYIVVAPDFFSRQIRDLASLYNFRMTENIIILQEKNHQVFIWTHSLISRSMKLNRLDSWKDGSFQKGKNLFPNKFQNFQRSVVRVANFEFAPSIIYPKDNNGNILSRIGVDMEVIYCLSVVKNFTVEFVEVKNMWGMRFTNGSWNGLMGQVYHQQSDLGIANVFIDDYRGKYVDYSYPYNFMPGCFATPSSKPLSNWQSPTLPFARHTWISIGISLLAGGPILYIVASLSVSKESQEFKSLSFNYLYILGSLTMRSVSTIPKHIPGRIYSGFVWTGCLILSTGYSANLIAFLSVKQMTAPINTIDQVIKSGLRLGGHEFWKSEFKRSEDQKMKTLASYIETDVHYIDVFNDVEAGEFSFVENKQYLELNRDARFTHGALSTIHIVRECLMSYSIALILPRNSPLTDNLTNALLRIYESGMMHKWKAEVTKYFREIYSDERSKTILEESQTRPLNLGHVQGIFYIMCVGYLTALVIFAYENVSGASKKKSVDLDQ